MVGDMRTDLAVCEHRWRYYPTLDSNPEYSSRECVICGKQQSRSGPTYLGDGVVLPGAGWETRGL